MKQKLSESEIREYADQIDFTQLPPDLVFSIDFIRQFRERIEWDDLSYFGCIAFNEKFFEEFKDDVNWNFILTKQKDKITEKIIERFKNERKCKEIK